MGPSFCLPLPPAALKPPRICQTPRKSVWSWPESTSSSAGRIPGLWTVCSRPSGPLDRQAHRSKDCSLVVGCRKARGAVRAAPTLKLDPYSFALLPEAGCLASFGFWWQNGQDNTWLSSSEDWGRSIYLRNTEEAPAICLARRDCQGPSPSLSICCLGLQYQVALQIICCQRNERIQNTSVFEIAFKKKAVFVKDQAWWCWSLSQQEPNRAVAIDFPGGSYCYWRLASGLEEGPVSWEFIFPA